MSKIKVLIVLCVTVLLLCVSCIVAGERYTEEFSKTLPLKAGERFSLENVNGGVAVATWKQSQVEIKAVKTARGRREDLDKVEIRVEEGAGRVSVEAVWPKFPRRASVSVDFTVMVPEGVELDGVGTVNGGVEVRGRFARAKVGTTNGSITVEDGAGELEAGTTNGSIHVSRFEGRLRAETTNGQIRLEGIAVKGGLSAETTNGSITMAVAAPEALNADLRAGTTNGHVTVDFPITLQSLRQSKRRIEGRIGQGGPEISLRTTNGSISLTR
ncbi:MAG: DUF4097 family beta strand repeat-containing protein [Acidobacteriota bacterium]